MAARSTKSARSRCEVGVLPRTHGSALFTRGETQALVTATLGTKDDEQRIELLEPAETSKRFMLHYNFPPFSVGEVGFMRGPGRREIGHGALAERALAAVIPDEKAFPYTMRVVSDILESNGSSSMATVCGATLALMDAGVPITAPVARHRDGPGEGRRRLRHPHRHRGRRRSLRRHGLQSRRHRRRHHRPADGYQGPERHHRDHEGSAGAGAQGAAVHPRQDDDAIAEPRTEMSQYAPRIYTMKIPTDKIRDVIGPGGKVIRGIIEQTGVKIDVEDDGTVNIFASDGDSAQTRACR